MYQLHLQDTYDTGIRELAYLVLLPNSESLLLGNYCDNNAWTFDWRLKQFTERFHSQGSLWQRWFRRRKDPYLHLPKVTVSTERPLHVVLSLFIAQGQKMAIDRDFKKLNTWLVNLETGERRLLHKGEVFSSAACLATLGRIALGGRKITVLEWPTGRKLAELPGHTDATSRLIFGPDSNSLISAGIDIGRQPRVRLWDIDGLKQVRVWKVHNPLGLAIHPDGQLLAVGGSPASIQFINLVNHERSTLDLNSPIGIGALCFSADGDYLYAGDWQGKLMLFKMQRT